MRGNKDRPKIHKYLPFIVLVIGILGGGLYLLFSATPVEALDQHNCLSCHGDLNVSITTSDGRRVSLLVTEQEIDSSVHKNIDCTTCHGEQPHSHPIDLSKVSATAECGSCHLYENQQYLSSIHGQQLEKGNTDVPSCVDCHSTTDDPHTVEAVLDTSASTYKKNIANTCGKCHNDPSLMQNYGIVQNVYETYMQSFHGKAIADNPDELSKLDAATCTNCHGAHDIKAVNDPTSSVAGMDNLVATCKQCHADAGPSFVKGFLGHNEPSPQNMAVVYYVGKGFNYLLYGVLGFAVLFIITAIYGFSRRKWSK